MKRALVLLVVVFAIASAVLALASARGATFGARGAGESDAVGAAGAASSGDAAELPGADDASASLEAGEERFAAYDVWIDSGTAPLAAWQVELAFPAGRAKLVGVEGGDAGAFAKPPYYDPKALAHGERIVLAAFDTGSELPSGRARVARIHVMVQGPEEPRVSARLAAAADPEGRALDARVEVRP
ncbi:MAG: hypothetical protein IPJ77_07090 [Planctomycetes bacterium]|nr:hypothetical protein [Planctomycetota bacterium]